MSIANDQQAFQQEIHNLARDSIWADESPELNTPGCYLSQPGWLIARCSDHPCHKILHTCLQRLRERFPDTALLSRLTADAYFRSPQTYITEEQSVLEKVTVYTYYNQFGRHALEQHAQNFRGWRTLRILNACLIEYFPPDIIERIRTCTEPYRIDGAQIPHLISSWLQDCFNLLLALPPSPELLTLLAELRPGSPWGPGGSWIYRAYDACEPLRDLLSTLFAYDAFNYEAFKIVALLIPYRFMREEFWRGTTDQTFLQQVEAYQERLAAEVAQHLSEENFKVILMFDRPLRGASWLLEAAREHSKLPSRKLIGVGGTYSPETIEQAIIRLARAEVVESSTEERCLGLVASLRSFPTATLKELFVVAAHARRILCVALGWNRVCPLVELVELLAAPSVSSLTGERESADVPNSTDPLSGVLDVQSVRDVLNQVDEDTAKEALALMVRGKAGVENAATLVRAVAGWNRTNVLQGVKRSGQISIKAYGLLPLTRSEEEVLERYLELQRQAKIGQKFGSSRRATQAAAVEVAKANLAQVAGYRDMAQLEWEMEARIVQQTTQAKYAWTVNEYELRIVLEGFDAAICVTRGGRVLKSIPKEVRASSVYKEAKEALALLRTHISRLRKGLLERLLETGETLTLEELSRLVSMPTARAMFELLVWVDAHGTIGLLEPETLALRGLDNTLTPLTAPAALAHPYHLFQAGVLSDWQRDIVHRRIVQPVKQVFRELYVLTPAEEQAINSSLRFAGHQVNSSIAVRLLTLRNWRFRRHNYDDSYAYKLFPGMRAVFELSPFGHYLGEPGSHAQTGSIFFERLPLVQNGAFEPSIIALDKIQPLIFSEVMRDADLVVSVAQTEQGIYYSPEMVMRTGEVAKTLLAELNLQGVVIDGHFAYVQGKLARYRIHLGSAAIHIEPGNYLCIVPTGWGQTHKDLFLPFADEQTKVSEVISKILLLLTDDQIKDESILRQIKQRR